MVLIARVTGQNILVTFKNYLILLKVTIIQLPGTGAIRDQISPSKPKHKITKITNSQYTKGHMVNRVSSPFQKGGHSATKKVKGKQSPGTGTEHTII